MVRIGKLFLSDLDSNVSVSEDDGFPYVAVGGIYATLHCGTSVQSNSFVVLCLVDMNSIFPL